MVINYQDHVPSALSNLVQTAKLLDLCSGDVLFETRSRHELT